MIATLFTIGMSVREMSNPRRHGSSIGSMHCQKKNYDVLNHYDTPHTGGIYKNDTPIMSNKASNRNRFVSFRPHPPGPSIPTSVRVKRTNVHPPSLPPSLPPMINKWGESADRTEERKGKKEEDEKKKKKKKKKSITHQPFPSPSPFHLPPSTLQQINSS